MPSAESLERARDLNRQYEGRGYTFRAHKSDVTMTIPLPEIVTRRDVAIDCGKQSLGITVSGEQIYSGMLFAEVHPDEATFTVSGGVLEVTLVMAEEEEWPQLYR
jgi:HSP20 family molecular chaperone IbpA